MTREELIKALSNAKQNNLSIGECWNLMDAAADMLEADGVQVAEPTPPFGSKRKAAMAVYTPPFKYLHGYIYDSQNLMVADDGDMKFGVEGAVASRVRGWGRFGYMPNGAELQDEIGQMMADALNALYTAPQTAIQERKPMTDEHVKTLFFGLKRLEISSRFSDENWFLAGVLASESAHGIGAKP